MNFTSHLLRSAATAATRPKVATFRASATFSAMIGWPHSRLSGRSTVWITAASSGDLGISKYANRRGAKRLLRGLLSLLAPRHRRRWLALTLILITFGFCAAGLVPLATSWAPWAWVVVLGLGIGGLFPLALTLPLNYSADANEASRLTAMTFFVGYVVAAIGPVAVGTLRDATGGYAVPFVGLAALSVGMLVAAFRFRPRPAPRP
jgi:MFS family permease